MQTIIENADFIAVMLDVFLFGMMIGIGIAPDRAKSNSDNS